ncbi:Helix-turn-helix domain-containing protein [Chitinophaga jiangningensis]|uniref:Helix-turn-helix domain-containing protein n=1 Tax=Chitinophaga jiangningensis TaxID=1419482 RepID=A0A1M7CZA6_9BACT|nr:helix-turn-helix domain-containing protein [Chitinophaga jiangningensis]SHL72566.1 Helix-turn-helix domain-containing protein [Chitinophaga jiangningensis]
MMKKQGNAPYRIESITALHRMLGLPDPPHPLVSIVHNCDVKMVQDEFPASLLLGFYKISFMKDLKGKIRYGQGYYDFDAGGMVFVATNQVLTVADDADAYEGFNLFLHPDFLQSYPLAVSIKKYDFFSYATNEALHLSAKEKETVVAIFNNIEAELAERIDDFSQEVVIAHIDLLLTYCKRFYQRQFTTRKAVNNDLLTRLETILNEYFNTATALSKGLPSVQYLADQLHLSSHYLSDMLRNLTGQNAQQHIHHHVIEKAKEALSTTSLSVGEIAWSLGFEHSQSFNRFFKQKTNIAPLDFRKSFN